jgi:hypothetical protein
MRQRHAIELAIDFARMPALGRTSVAPPIPPNIIEVMEIAAGSPKACEDAAAAIGEPVEHLTEAARFYLQQALFRPEADCHRVLGLQPGATRAMARAHMRLLLEWLHPDRNNGLEAVYAERVIKAWREFSNGRDGQDGRPVRSPDFSTKSRRVSSSFRLPWIKQPITHPRGRTPSRILTTATWALPATALLLVVLWSAVYLWGLGPLGLLISLP